MIQALRNLNVNIIVELNVSQDFCPPTLPPTPSRTPMEHTLGEQAIGERGWALESRKIGVECCVALDLTLNLSDLEIPTP